MKKYDLGELTNTVIDTLELSRVLDQGYARHGLSALVKRYNVPWEEDAHHRADYDAEGTARVFSKMLQKLTAQNYKVISDLDKLVSKDEIQRFFYLLMQSRARPHQKKGNVLCLSFSALLEL